MPVHESSRLKVFFKNLLYAFAAQGISLLLSVLMAFIVPKLLGVTEYGYWQLFLFYVSYAGFFQFGLIDGIYLRYGGEKYADLDYALIGSQFWISLAAQIAIALVFSLLAVRLEPDRSRLFALVCALIYMVIGNSNGLLGYVFRATNNTRVYSVGVMIYNILFICFAAILVVFRQKNFEAFTVFYLVSQLISFLYICVKGKKLLLVCLKPLLVSLREMKKNILIGINLMFSNVASMLIVGLGRYITIGLWGIAQFGRFSFSLSLTNFFLLFISQVSMVLFPALRESEEKRLVQFYGLGRDAMGIALAGVFLLYMPTYYLLGLWLPQYQQSLRYLAIMLPLCTFDGKMEMLFSTYLKVLRKERVLLGLNAFAFAVSAVLSIIGGYIIGNIYAIMISMVLVVGMRSILAEWYLSRRMHMHFVKSVTAECLLAALFVASTWFIGAVQGFCLYLIAYVAYLFLAKNKIRLLARYARALLAR